MFTVSLQASHYTFLELAMQLMQAKFQRNNILSLFLYNLDSDFIHSIHFIFIQ